MRALFGLLASCCCMGVLSAQQPQFVMPIWFEDIVGNKDTVWVGGDPSASSQHLNPQFGEVAIATPFDSVFEVRGVHGADTDWETSKIVIEHDGSPGQCYLPAHTRLMIHAKYLPVKISWDTTLLATNYPCNINTILTPDQYVFLLQNWYEARIIYCMMTKASIELYDLFSIPPPDQLEHPFDVEGQGEKVLPGLWFTGFWDFPHCYTTLPTPKIDRQETIALSPNPVTDYLKLFNHSELGIRTVRIYNSAGQIVLSNAYKTKAINILPLEGLTSGFYVVQIILENGKTITKTIIKE